MSAIYVFYILAIGSTLGIHIPSTGQKSLLNKHLKVAAGPYSSFIIFYCKGRKMGMTDKCSDGGSMTYGGALWELLKLVQLSKNVTFSLKSLKGIHLLNDSFNIIV